MFKAWLFFFLFISGAGAVIDAPVNPIDFAQNPSSVNWKKIDTKHFEIIFPEEVTEEAKRVAHLLERAWPFVTRSMEVKPPKIPLFCLCSCFERRFHRHLVHLRKEILFTCSK